jgi:hypothetical protein
MRLANLISKLFSKPRAAAAEAIEELHGRLTDYGTMVLYDLTDKANDPERKNWPLEGEDWVILKHVEVFKKGVGNGTRMMEALCKICNKHGCKIFLDARPLGEEGLDFDLLTAFYLGFGFADFPEMLDFTIKPMIRWPD